MFAPNMQCYLRADVMYFGCLIALPDKVILIDSFSV